MSLKTKFFMLAFFPFLLLLMSGGYIGHKAYEIYLNSDLIYKNMGFSKIISKLIHETQKERGASAGYLNGGLSIEELEKQRLITDKFYNASYSLLNKISVEESVLILIQNNFKKYATLRSKIDSKSINNAESVVSYAQIISQWIDYHALIAGQSIFGDISSANRTLQSLEVVKEYIGNLRAVSMGLISLDKPLSEKEVRRIQDLMQGAVISINSKALTFTPKANEYKKNFLDAPEWIKVVEIYNLMLLKKDTGDFGVNAFQYWGTITKAIDKLNELIAFQLDETSNLVFERYSQAKFEIVLIVSILFSVSIGLFILIFKITKNLTLSLGHATENMSLCSHDILITSEEMEKNAKDLFSATETQASSLEETSSSISEISAIVGRSASAAKNTSVLAEQSQLLAQQGQQSVANVIEKIELIHQSNENLMASIEYNNREIENITTIIGDISEKTKVINDIVFQTKLLSFNASVEAARAGEHGKGFSVVAQEIGALAQMSGNASAEIKELLEMSVNKVRETVSNSKDKVSVILNEGKRSVNEGVDEIKKCDEFLQKIVNSFKEVNHSVQEIASSSSEQSVGVDQIKEAIHFLNESTRKSSSIAKKTSSSSSQMGNYSESLNEIVGTLKHIVYGKKGNNSAHVDFTHDKHNHIGTDRENYQKAS